MIAANLNLRPEPRLCVVCRVKVAKYARQTCRACYGDPQRRAQAPIRQRKPAPRAEVACRHCQVKAANRSRGLCWTCYYTPGIRERYQTDTQPPGNRRGSRPDFFGGYRLPEPTDTLPGSPERLAVLTERARLGQALSHPQDTRLPLD